MKSQYAKQIRRCASEWFKHHRAGFGPTNVNPCVLNWAREDGRFTYCLRYIITGTYLIVVGDAGDAVYQWGEGISWEFLKSTDLEYFVSKCQASEVGRRFQQWDSRRMITRLEEFFNDTEKKPDKQTLQEIYDDTRDTGSSDDWIRRMEQEDHVQHLGYDYWELAQCGYGIHVRAIGHWVGLQMALGNTENMLKRYEE